MNMPNQRLRVRGGFWRRKVDVVAEEMLPYQWKALNDQIPGAEPSHALENFRIAAGESQGTFAGTIFQDSDVAKWLEAASYSLADKPSAALEALVDEAIRLVSKAQGPDGYINTWFTLVGPDKRWSDLPWGHELYCGGHLIEAAVGHFESTGSRKFLDVMARYADGLIPIFGPGGPHAEDACGHPEVELALHRLADATGESKYRDLAIQFVEVRGKHPDRFLDQPSLTFDLPFNQWYKPDYFLAHEPVRHQHHAEGHAVRAMYLYNAMARQALSTGDPGLKAVLEDLWNSVTDHRMYLTGGIGSHAVGERFTVDYDLPSDTAYTETCASIGFYFWARSMLDLDPQSRYADGAERVLYNGALSGMALDGKRFFYVNPLEVIPKVAHKRQDLEHVKTERVPWFGCSCCPPNIARTVASVASAAWIWNGSRLRVDQYIDSEGQFATSQGAVRVTLETKYPWEGRILLSFKMEGAQKFSLALRIPGWCRSYQCSIVGVPVEVSVGSDGYFEVERIWHEGDRVELDLHMPVRFLAAHPGVAELAGRVAVTRGPLVFCAEEADNGPGLHNLTIDPKGRAEAVFLPDVMGGTIRITVPGTRTSGPGSHLYEDWDHRVTAEPFPVVLFPYHQWGNRRPGQEMRVWLRT
jgi:DUF1680 family protein